MAELSGRLYCVGGSDGQRTLKSCEVYNMEENQWTYIAPLNTGKAVYCTQFASLVFTYYVTETVLIISALSTIVAQLFLGQKWLYKLDKNGFFFCLACGQLLTFMH